MRRAWSCRVAIAVAVAGGLLGGSCSRAPQVQELAAARGGGTVTVKSAGSGEQTITVESPKGIGAVDVGLDPKRPRRVVLEFLLPALERLHVSFADVAVEAVVKANGDIHERRADASGATGLLAPGDSLWMPVHIARSVPGDAQSAIRAIRIEASPALQHTPADTLHIEWVDFYR